MEELAPLLERLAQQFRVDTIVLGEAAVRSFWLSGITRLLIGTAIIIGLSILGWRIGVWFRESEDEVNSCYGPRFTFVMTLLFVGLVFAITSQNIPRVLEPLGTFVRATIN